MSDEQRGPGAGGDAPPDSKLDVQVPRSGLATIKVRDGSGQILFTEQGNVTSIAGRHKVAARLAERLGKGFGKPTDPVGIEKDLEKNYAKALNENEKKQEDGQEDGQQAGGGVQVDKASQATLLVATAEAVELFHSPEGDAYAGVPVDGHVENSAVRSKAFRRWLSRKYYEKYGGVPGGQAVQDAVGVLEGKALYDGPEHKVHVRLADHGGDIFLDLADAKWRVVRVTPDGWSIEDKSPVKFVRKKGMLPLPPPVPGGKLKKLRRFINIKTRRQWMLLVGWLLQALRPRGPYPILALSGEQGSAKSTAARLLRSLIDPNSAPLRSEPREGRDLMIAATNSWVAAFDNLSRLPHWLSDALCRLATGGGFATRELFTDTDEMLFDATRATILTAIEDLMIRGDLADRAVAVVLPAIPDSKRRREDRLWADFEAARPRILGALLDAVSAALKNLPNVKMKRLPRMADFVFWVTAAEPALGWKKGSFYRAYADNAMQVNREVLEGSLIAQAIGNLMAPLAKWEGTFRGLLAALEGAAEAAGLSAKVADAKRKGDWPGTPKGMSDHLRRLAPNLRGAGIGVILPEDQPKPRGGKGGNRIVTLVLLR